MVYKFDPSYWNGTIFHLEEDTWEMSGDWDEYECDNLPIPASCFPRSLTFDGARAALPDMFHTNRDIIMFSERARLVMEQWAPGQVEFVPVAVNASPKIAGRLNFDSTYYFINVLGRASGCNGSTCRRKNFHRWKTVRSNTPCCQTSAIGGYASVPPKNR
jgi:hypothetical protein